MRFYAVCLQCQDHPGPLKALFPCGIGYDQMLSGMLLGFLRVDFVGSLDRWSDQTKRPSAEVSPDSTSRKPISKLTFINVNHLPNISNLPPATSFRLCCKNLQKRPGSFVGQPVTPHQPSHRRCSTPPWWLLAGGLFQDPPDDPEPS